MFNDETKMRARFAELTKLEDSIRAKSNPLRERRDKFSNDARAKEMVMIAEIAAIEAPLPAIAQERAALVRALKGKTSAPEEVKPE